VTLDTRLPLLGIPNYDVDFFGGAVSISETAGACDQVFQVFCFSRLWSSD
jgi:hypothetical protein